MAQIIAAGRREGRAQDDGPATLVVGPGWVGDMVMAQCLFGALKRAAPDTPIDVMAPAGSGDLLARMPQVRTRIAAPFPRGSLSLRARWRAAQDLRGRYRDAYVLPGSWKSALVPFLAGVPRRIGYRREFRFGLLSDARPLPHDLRRHTAEAFAALAGSGPIERPRLIVDGIAQAVLLARFGLAGRPFAVLMPGAEFGPAKRWPPRHYATLARTLQKRGLAVVLLGSPGDVAVAHEILALAPGAINLCGQTRLLEAVDILAAARLAVSNDSGLMHVAAAVGTPVVAVYGSTSPDDTPPLTERAALLTHRLPCSPCHDRHCRLGHHACLEHLEAAEVAAAAERLAA